MLHRAARRVAGIGIAYDNELGGRMWAGLVDRRALRSRPRRKRRRLPGRTAAGAVCRGPAELSDRTSVPQSRGHRAHRRGGGPPLRCRGRRAGRGRNARGDRLPGRRASAGRTVGSLARASRDGPGTSPASAIDRRGGSPLSATRASRSRGRVLSADASGPASTGGRRSMARLSLEPARCGSFPRPARLGRAASAPARRSLGGSDGFPGPAHRRAPWRPRGDARACCFRRRSRDRCSRVSSWPPVVRGRRSVSDSEGWVAGVRAGIGAETPLGPVRFEYGLATRGRDALFVRLGAGSSAGQSRPVSGVA